MPERQIKKWWELEYPLQRETLRRLSYNNRNYESKLELSGENTPKVLFHGLTEPKPRTKSVFEKGILNEEGDTIFCTNSPWEAATYGLRMRDLTTIWGYSGTRYIHVLFPHETTDLARWAIEWAAPVSLINAEIFVTNQLLRIEDMFLVAHAQLPKDIEDLIAGGLITRNGFMEVLGITNEGQRSLYQAFRQNLGYQMQSSDI